jgi:hypothetical protein
LYYHNPIAYLNAVSFGLDSRFPPRWAFLRSKRFAGMKAFVGFVTLKAGLRMRWDWFSLIAIENCRFYKPL